jgi:hypothetical protein
MRAVARAGWLLVLFAACDPIWQMKARVRDPSSRPVAEAVVVLACPKDPRYGGGGPVAETDAEGVTHVTGMGFYFPECDVLVLRPGYRTYRLPFAELCPGGRERCERTARFEVVLEPE